MRTDEIGEFRAFVAGRSPALLRFSILVTGDHEMAEEVLQDALVKTYLAWGRLRSTDALESYVKRTIVNNRTSLWRRRGRETPISCPPDQAGRDETATVDAREVLIAALMTLPAKQRAAVVLRHYEGLTEAEAARVLDVSVGTVKSSTAKGLQKMRTLLGLDLFGDDGEGNSDDRFTQTV